MRQRFGRLYLLFLFGMLAAFVLSACNLGAGDTEATLTPAPSATGVAPTRTLLPDGAIPTQAFVTVTPPQFPTLSQATSVAVFPTAQLPPVQPTSTPVPVSIIILSPVPGNIASGNVQVLGSAIHPNFLQYRLEYGPDPNPSNLWFPITSVIQQPVLNGSLGIWNTNTAASPDGVYQLRLRVFLRDGRQEITTAGNIHIRNQQPTPQPTNTQTIPRPIAAFTQDRTSGNAPLVIRFSNLSQGQISSYSWEFGDTGNSNQANPVHTYQSPGVYTVTLRVTGPGGTANVSRQINVTSPSAPVASFNVNPTSGEAPLTVTFTNTTTGSYTTSLWDFGDGETSTSNSPSHTFDDVGTYNVILQVIGPGGTAQAVRQITVENPQVPAPVAGFTPSVTSGNVPLTVTFGNTTTGETTMFLWDFDGDGITDSTDKDPTYVFQNPGTFEVLLTALGPGGQSSTTASITASQPVNAPVAGFNVSPASGDAPLTVQFTNTTTGDVTGYSWDFNNDGIPDSTAQSPSFTFLNAGTYTVRLAATGPGGTTTAQKTVTVLTPLEPPSASFEANPTVGEAPLSVIFTNTSVGSELTFAWDFNGDGTVDSDASNPTFVYQTAGTYEASLRVTNPVGEDSYSLTVTVEEDVEFFPPTAAFNATPTTGLAPLEVAFQNQSFGDVTGYEWDFDGDGSVDSTDTSPTFTYQGAGQFVASLKAIGPGGENTVSTTITVEEPSPPVADFAVDFSSGNAPLTVTFTGNPSGTVDSFSWDFDGDGIADNASALTTQFTYNQPGEYTATFTVNGAGQTDSASQTITVNAAPQPPTASLSVDVSSGPAPLTVTFTNETDPATFDAVSWDFNNDGTADSTDTPTTTFTYDQAGTYTAVLYVAKDGLSGSATQQITVSEPAPPEAPNVTFNAQPTSGTAPLEVTFSITTPADTYTSLSWDFDNDGIADNTTDTTATHTYQQEGTYTATLMLDNNGASASASQTITVNAAPVPPVANFTVDFSSGNAPLIVTFTSTSTGDVESLSWDFNGDGAPDNTTDATATFTYNNPGSYNATLTVNGAGTADTITQAITVSAAPVAPVASFTADPISGTAPLTVTFTSTSTGDVESLSWDFNGDGAPDNTTDGTATFTYNNPGDYNATLTVNGAGTNDTISQVISVSAAPVAPVASFTAAPTSGTAPLTVTFTNTSTGDVEGLSWDFNGDGTPDNTTDGTTTFTYNNPGDYNATLTVNGAGTSDSIAQVISVSAAVVPPVASFTADPTSGSAPLTVAFTSTSTGDVENFSWDFNGDGTPDNTTDATATFTYDTAGDYNVTLTVNGAGTSNSTSQVISVTSAAPVIPTGNLAFVTDRDGNNEIYVTDSTGPVNVTNNPASDTDPVWSPDGSKIAFVSDRSGNDDIYVLTLADMSVAQLTNDGNRDLDPAWSPDGTKIAFASDRFGDLDILIMNADGSNPVALTTETAAERHPTWSPDGQRIAYQSDITGNQDLFVTEIGNPGNVVQLTTDGQDDTEPVWSPNSDNIAYIAARDADGDVFLVNANTAESTRIMTNDSMESGPAWSADGTQIMYASNAFGDLDLFTMNADGSNPTQYTTSPSNDFAPSLK
ncbi:MAG: PKD domain-containing protein [Anaerolineaceae bacterium]|nr:PKD domain-containing protein [Anaerolineaceae bacterium]